MAPPLALTLGEPAGIGPDITFAAWRRRIELDLPPFYLLADPNFVMRCAERIAPDVTIAVVEPAAACAAFKSALPVVDVGVAVSARPGHPDRSSAPAAVAAIRRAVADVTGGAASAIVTNPVAKNVLYRSGFAEPGHTEFLAKLAEQSTGVAVHPVMMLWSPELAVVPVTIHLPLKDVAARLTTDLVVETGRIVARDLRDRFGIAHPRLAVAGLNPHAGEDGALGDEDRTVVGPAVERLREEGIDARGPLPAELVVSSAGARELRRGAGDVSRPGADPDQDAGIRSRGQCHAGSAVRTHVARSRHRLRHRRHGPRRSHQPDRRPSARGKTVLPRRVGPGRAS